MTPQEHMVSALEAMQRSIDDAGGMLRQFNEPDWPGVITAALASASAIVSKHIEHPDPTIGDDCLNVVGILAQICWPGDIQDRDRDDRLALLRGRVGVLRMDLDAILSLYSDIAGHDLSDSVAGQPTTVQISKSDHEEDIRAIVGRLSAIETFLNDHISQEARPDRPRRQIEIVGRFLENMQVNILTVKAAINIGPILDLSVVERAAIAMVSATRSLFETVTAVASRATDSLRVAARLMAEPIGQFVRGVRTLALKIVDNQTVHTTEPDISPETAEPSVEEAESTPVGALLRDGRERAGISIQAIASETRIPVNMLKAIEVGDYSRFLSPMHLVGFVANYASAIGENHYEFRRLIRAELAAKRPWFWP